MGEDLEGRKHFSECLFEATFPIMDDSGGYGTCFIVRCRSSRFTYLVTARHVLDGMSGDSATVLFRVKQADDSYRRLPHRIAIRDSLGHRYYAHPDTAVDIAVLKLVPPKDSSFLSQLLPFGLDSFATDQDIRKYWIHPGDVLFFLGYPLAQTSSEGVFPILRSGYVASYPILPLSKHPRIFMDGPVFEGNSGGPVYFEYYASSWGDRMVNQKGKIVGLTSAYTIKAARRKMDSVSMVHDLELGVFVNSGYILELFDSLGCD
jgi:S1-C subfamily serine protease